jgi:hypothetical protein
LAFEACLNQSTVKNIETGKSLPSVLSVSTVQRALEAAGIEFTDGEPRPGVKLRKR